MHYDLIVIGSGGGTKVSTPAAKQGKKVAIIEEERYGGTCLNKGCIPSKMLIHPANIIAHAKNAQGLGLSATIKSDFPAIVKRVTNTVSAESESIPRGYDDIPTLDHYEGHAKFVGEKTIVVGDETLTADTIVIAVGSRPSIPPIKGLSDTPYMTSKEALRNTSLPETLIIIGGGYIACELGHAYKQYGSETRFLVRSGLIGREDEEVVEEFTSAFTKEHEVVFGTTIKSVSYDDKTFTVTYEQEGTEHSVQGDSLLVATGVKPNTQDLGLENTSIRVDESGYVKVDDHLKAADGVYAIGDVVGNYLFRHSVNFEGEYLYERLFGGGDAPIAYPPMPHAIFTSPEVAGVGRTQEELESEGVEYVVGKNSYKASAQGMARLSEHGFVKILVAPTTREVLGCHIIGDEASIMIHQVIQVMTMRGTLDDLLRIIYIHPALPEILRNACRDAQKKLLV